MKWMWRPIDALAEWLQHGISTEVQQRAAVLTVLISIPVGLIGPLLPPGALQQLIYGMSALALTLTGITWLAGLQSKRAAEENGSSAVPSVPPPPVP